ncbi:unnamed protein product [Ambrosiozyma monospora]|uniref:Unnamed protein product n=1 Tax=Ambrosiozyma monospora TaxID=43982 RepID=A0ACB5TJZ2_AMBMO|nr:unnamed protein product [Ambrosiozyma monospora]
MDSRLYLSPSKHPYSKRSSRHGSPLKMKQPFDAYSSPSKSRHNSIITPSAPVTNTNIKVIVRFRPPSEQEPGEYGRTIVDYSEKHEAVTITTTNHTFQFDHIFPEQTEQEEIFNYSVKQTTEDLAAGYNGTVLCYGQTGSGKSYTMMGELETDKKKGLIPRIFEQIFRIIEQSPKTLEYTVGVSYMEIYNETLRDLLNSENNSKLQIHENKVDGVFVSHLETLYVADLVDVYTILEQGNLNRSTGATNMNEQSSRSHAIFQIKLSSKNLEDGVIKSGNLFLVDLAGSEKIDKTCATGQTLEEAKRINSSLSALGNVIYSLTDGKSAHVPYRDSKLTRILQESLGGNSRTTLIINCSPTLYNEQETLSTLRFASRAKRIQNSVHVNSELSNSELKKRYLEEVKTNGERQIKIQKLSEENEMLRKELKKYKDLVETMKSNGNNSGTVKESIGVPLSANGLSEMTKKPNGANFNLNDTILDLKLQN